MHVLVCPLTCAFMCGMRLRMLGLPSRAPAVDIVVFESVWNGGHDGSDGADYVEG